MGQVRAVHVPGFTPAAQAFVAAHTDARAWSPGTARKYRQTLTALAAHLAGDGVESDLALLDSPVGARQLAAAFAAAFGTSAPATLARHRSTVRSGKQ